MSCDDPERKKEPLDEESLDQVAGGFMSSTASINVPATETGKSSTPPEDGGGLARSDCCNW